MWRLLKIIFTRRLWWFEPDALYQRAGWNEGGALNRNFKPCS